MKKIIALLIAVLPMVVCAQRLHADLYLGASTYQGDLQGKRITYDNAYLAGGIGLSYDLTNKLIVRGAANYMTVGGNDKSNSTAKGVTYRNLNFRSRVIEAQLGLEYNFLDLSDRNFTPYVFAGAALFNFDPYTYDPAGTRAFLRLLNTEGQGLAAYPDRKQYKNKQFAIPFGGGLKFALSDKLQVSLELDMRKLFTDYLDDVSMSYADSALLLAARGPQSVALAYRGNELPGAPAYPTAGQVRGNPANKDWYYTTGLRVSYLFGNGSGGRNRGSKLACPTRVY